MTANDGRRNNRGNPSTQWKKGVSGNPGGRPRKLPITERIAERIEKKLTKTKKHDKLRKKFGLSKDATYADLGVAELVDQAAAGDLAAFRQVQESIEGRANTRLQITMPGGGSMTLEQILNEDTGASRRAPTWAQPIVEDAKVIDMQPAATCPNCNQVLCPHERCIECDGCDECPGTEEKLLTEGTPTDE